MDIVISVTKKEINVPFQTLDGLEGTLERKEVSISSHDIEKVSTEELMDVHSGLNVSLGNVTLELTKRGVRYSDPISVK